MQQRTLGTSGLTVSALGLGCMGMSQSYGPGNEEESLATLNRAVELGMTFFDTADVYGAGANEILVGKGLKPYRNRLVIATKFGFTKAGSGMPGGICGKPDYVKRSCEASLKRLGFDWIDLYYLHRVDPETPVEDTVGAMSRLVEEGKVRYLGLSEASTASLRRAHGVHPITALQSEYSLWTRDIEQEHLAVCRELGIGIVPFSPLGRGFLSGRVRESGMFSEGDFRKSNPRFEGGNLAKNLELVAKIEAVAAAKKCSPAQLSLAWVLAQANDIVPIPGTKRRIYLEENNAALGIELTPDDVKHINEAIPPGSAAGARYNDEMMKAVNR